MTRSRSLDEALSHLGQLDTTSPKQTRPHTIEHGQTLPDDIHLEGVQAGELVDLLNQSLRQWGLSEYYNFGIDTNASLERIHLRKIKSRTILLTFERRGASLIRIKNCMELLGDNTSSEVKGISRFICQLNIDIRRAETRNDILPSRR